MKSKKKIKELEDRISQLEIEMKELKQLFHYKYTSGPYITKIVPCETPTIIPPPIVTYFVEASK